VIETERLVLRLPVQTDADAIYRHLSDPEVMRWIGVDGETGTRADAVERAERWKRNWELDGFGHFIAVRRDTGEVVGRVGLLSWDPQTWRNGTRTEIGDHAEIELGWTLERVAWGNGFATEAATAVRDWALREVQPRRLISLIHPDNARSIRVAEKIGEEYQHDIVMHHGATVQLWELASEP
jgi:[ribosomal protein S5]-alanine N-acetyltransferase